MLYCLSFLNIKLSRCIFLDSRITRTDLNKVKLFACSTSDGAWDLKVAISLYLGLVSCFEYVFVGMKNHVFLADGVCVQSIEHPGCVWDAKFLENGDIVTACSDGIVRVWTIDHDRIADAVELDSFATQLSQYKISRYGVFCFFS